jgi:hypothetical protein
VYKEEENIAGPKEHTAESRAVEQNGAMCVGRDFWVSTYLELPRSVMERLRQS